MKKMEPKQKNVGFMGKGSNIFSETANLTEAKMYSCVIFYSSHWCGNQDRWHYERLKSFFLLCVHSFASMCPSVGHACLNVAANTRNFTEEMFVICPGHNEFGG